MSGCGHAWSEMRLWLRGNNFVACEILPVTGDAFVADSSSERLPSVRAESAAVEGGQGRLCAVRESVVRDSMR